MGFAKFSALVALTAMTPFYSVGAPEASHASGGAKAKKVSGFVYREPNGEFYFLRKPLLLAPHVRVVFAGPKEMRSTCVSSADERAGRCPVQFFSIVPERKAGSLVYRETRPLDYGGFQLRAGLAETFGRL